MPESADGAQGGAGGSENGGHGASNGGSGKAGSAPLVQARTDGTPDLSNRALDSIIARFGDERKALRAALSDNFKYRRRADAAASIPEGGVVLSKDDAAKWRKFIALDKTPDEIGTVLREHATLTAEKSERDALDAIGPVARKAGYNLALVHRVAKADGVRLEVRSVNVRGDDGKTTAEKVLHVVAGEGDKAVATPIDDYRAEHWADVVPEPTPQDADDDEGGSNGNGTRASDGTSTAQRSRPYPPQSSGNKPAKQTTATLVKTQLANRYNPKPATAGAGGEKH